MVRPWPGASKVRKLIDNGRGDDNQRTTVPGHNKYHTEIGSPSQFWIQKSISDIKLRKSVSKSFTFGLRCALKRPTQLIVLVFMTLTHLTTVIRDLRSGQGDLAS
jgi:hypothetical protein